MWPWGGQESSCAIAGCTDAAEALRDRNGKAVLAWKLSQHQQEIATRDILDELHGQIETCLGYFSAEVLSDSSTSGMLLGREMGDGQMSAADTIVRLGQHLCRWATQQSPPFGLRIGVDVGQLNVLQLPNSGGRRAYFGSACSGALHLAEAVKQDGVVHLARRAKDELITLRHLRLTLSPVSAYCYYLDPATEVVLESASTLSVSSSLLALDLREEKTAEERCAKMPYEEFLALLRRHQVPLSKFGRGSAKSLQEFYDAVVRDQKSYLIVHGGLLERVVELVRISLRTRGPGNRMHELKIRSEPNAEGGTRSRNQPLAMVIDQSMAGKWQEASQRCFEVKLGLSLKEQQAYFTVDRSAYSFQEDRSHSETIPGIMTTYRKHGMALGVKDKAKKEQLAKLGLPECSDFTTETADGHTLWTWAPVEDDREDELITLLQSNGIDPSEFTWQAFTELYEEVYEKQQSCLEVNNGEVVRTIRIVKVWIHADVLNVDHVLVVRAKHQKGTLNNFSQSVISMRMNADSELEDSVAELLQLRLGIGAEVQQKLFNVDMSSCTVNEEIAYSRTYPGVKTLYEVNTVNVRVLHPQDSRLHFIGLPGGTDFTFVREEPFSKGGESDTVITHFGWQLADEMDNNNLGNRSERLSMWGKTPSIRDRLSAHSKERRISNDSARAWNGGQLGGDPMLATPSGLPEEGEDCEDASVGRVDTYDSRGVGKMITTDSARVAPPKALTMRESDELLLGKLMLGKQTDWLRARRAAERICHPDYTTRDFYMDVKHAFPELRLYCISRSLVLNGTEVEDREKQSLSGARTADDEYQRTVGALFAVFWLMRLHLDGKKCFCFGMDDQYQPKEMPVAAEGAELSEDDKKRVLFYENMDWARLEDLVVQAGLLQQPRGPHDPERTLAILVLMTIHDIMKLDVLQPVVSKALREFRGYRSGEKIGDHDIALSYVLEHCPSALPSFYGLPKEQQDSLKFTHCKLDYNFGWLVQGEAPPGALFKAFREVIISGKASSSDIAFYFVHWFADLAGAEPYPMQGCQKFVLKFPRKVLQSFVDSFQVVWTLSPTKSETQVFEDYLLWRWHHHDPPLGPPPEGKGSIAQLRLILMAQGDSQEVLKQLSLLPREDWTVLADELAMTGCRGQSYQRDVLGHAAEHAGPALLVYYAPALLQKCCKTDAAGALQVLSEVLREARALWPLSTQLQDVNRTVTIRIDALKDLEVREIRQPVSGHGLVLHKSSTQDGLVRLVPLGTFRELDWGTHQILDFSEQRGKRYARLEPFRRDGGGRAGAGWRLPRFMRRLSGATARDPP